MLALLLLLSGAALDSAKAISPDVAAVAADPAPIPPEALKPGNDFSLSLLSVGKPRGKARTRDFAVRIANIAKWDATSVRACVTVTGSNASIVSVGVSGIKKGKRAACWLEPKIGKKKSKRLSFRLKTSRPLTGRRNVKVKVHVASGNSRTRSASLATRRAKAVPARGMKVKRQSRKARKSTAQGWGAETAAVSGSRRSQAATCGSTQALGVVFLADDSGSMDSNDPDELRATAIQIGLDQIPDGSVAAATTFESSTYQLFGPTVVDSTSRSKLKGLADNMYGSGGTDYQLAFEAAWDQLQAMPSTVGRKAVVFMSDGDPGDPDFDAHEPIVAAGIPIFTIGLGDIGDGVLERIAAQSGGQSFRADSAQELQSIYARVSALLTCSAASASATVLMPPGKVVTLPFDVGLNDGEFRALAAWSGKGITVRGIRPDGTRMAPGDLRRGETFSDNPTYASLIGMDPAVGRWQVEVTADSKNADTVSVSIDVFDKGLPKLPPLPAIDVATQGRKLDVCISAYGATGKMTTKKILLGKEINYNLAESLYMVCAGFGAPLNVQLSVAHQCALMVASNIALGNAVPAVGTALEVGCTGTDVLEALKTRSWAPLGSLACGWATSVLGTGLGTAAGVASANPGAGVLVYRAIAAGGQIACSGVAGPLGEQWEADHETRLAADVVQRGKCLRQTERAGQVFWSSTTCS